MSQITIAVFRGSHSVGVVTLCQRFESGATSTRFRRFTVSGLAFSAAGDDVVTSRKKQHRQPATTRNDPRMAISGIPRHSASTQFDGTAFELPVIHLSRRQVQGGTSPRSPTNSPNCRSRKRMERRRMGQVSAVHVSMPVSGTISTHDSSISLFCWDCADLSHTTLRLCWLHPTLKLDSPLQCGLCS